MVERKLGKLSDRTTVRLTISLMPDLHEAPTEYAAHYAQTYGRDELITEPVPAFWKATARSAVRVRGAND
jgi:hypothetical protein